MELIIALVIVVIGAMLYFNRKKPDGATQSEPTKTEQVNSVPVAVGEPPATVVTFQAPVEGAGLVEATATKPAKKAPAKKAPAKKAAAKPAAVKKAPAKKATKTAKVKK